MTGWVKGGDLCKVCSNILPLINRKMASCAETLGAEQKLTFPCTHHLPLILTINAFQFAFSPPCDIPLFTAFCGHFPPITKTISPVLRHISPDCDICTQEELNVCSSLSPESAPVGWSLITMEWAANGVCTAPQPPDPSAPPNGSPWRPVTEWQGAFYWEVNEVQWLEGGPDPCASCAIDWTQCLLTNNFSDTSQ